MSVKVRIKVSMMINIAVAIMFISMFTSCVSPEERIREKMNYETEYFIKSHQYYHSNGSEVSIYNVANNVNYLAHDDLRKMVISCANDCCFWGESFKANEDMLKLLSKLKKNKSENKIGGIWVYHEIGYKEYIYKHTYSGPYIKRKLYLFSEDGEKILWSSEIHFSDGTFRDLLNITNTHYDFEAEAKYKTKMNKITTLVVLVCILLLILLIVWNNKRKEPIRRAQEEAKAKKAQEEAKLKKKQEWKKLLDKRAEMFGNLTKHVVVNYNEEESDIYVYEESKTIFVLGKQYAFSDILSCRIETICKRGKTTSYTTTTTPDKGDMALQQLLYGSGQKYNVKSHSETHVKTTPDTYIYKVYIGVKSISEPQLVITKYLIDKANEINSLFNAIIDSNKQVQ